MSAESRRSGDELEKKLSLRRDCGASLVQMYCVNAEQTEAANPGGLSGSFSNVRSKTAAARGMRAAWSIASGRSDASMTCNSVRPSACCLGTKITFGFSHDLMLGISRSKTNKDRAGLAKPAE